MGLDRLYGHTIGAGYVHARKSLGFAVCVRCLLGGHINDLLFFWSSTMDWTQKATVVSFGLYFCFCFLILILYNFHELKLRFDKNFTVFYCRIGLFRVFLPILSIFEPK